MRFGEASGAPCFSACLTFERWPVVLSSSSQRVWSWPWPWHARLDRRITYMLRSSVIIVMCVGAQHCFASQVARSATQPTHRSLSMRSWNGFWSPCNQHHAPVCDTSQGAGCTMLYTRHMPCQLRMGPECAWETARESWKRWAMPSGLEQRTKETPCQRSGQEGHPIGKQFCSVRLARSDQKQYTARGKVRWGRSVGAVPYSSTSAGTSSRGRNTLTLLFLLPFVQTAA